MTRNYYSEINLHITWHTKDSLPILTPRVEPVAHDCLKNRLVDMLGVFVHEIGGTETHVHLCVTVPPTVAISDMIGKLKGGTSHDVNHALGTREAVLQWQKGYGVVSFGTRDLEWVKTYVRNQKEHHAQKTTHERLERITENGV